MKSKKKLHKIINRLKNPHSLQNILNIEPTMTSIFLTLGQHSQQFVAKEKIIINNETFTIKESCDTSTQFSI